MGADISFGYLNKLPMRQKDIAQERKQLQMKSIFGGLTGSSKRIPTSEGLSDEDEKEAAQKLAAINEETAQVAKAAVA